VAGRDGGRALRALALTAVATGLAAVTAAACALSYTPIHMLAGEAGVSASLARIYPYVFDAMLVLAGCSVLALRGAGLPSRSYGWLCFLVLLAALAAGGAIRAADVSVPRHSAGVIGAIVPFVLVLIGFGLLLTLLRHARLRRASQRSSQHRDADGEVAARVQVAPLADLQLRARIPRPAPATAGTGGRPAAALPAAPGPAAAAPGHNGPLLPPVAPIRSPWPFPPPEPLAEQEADAGEREAGGQAESADPPALDRPHGLPTPPED
jgi:uncharacterized membrane protein SirB2